MKKPSFKHTIKKIFQIILVGTILFFFISQLLSNWDKLLEYEWKFNYNFIILATLLYIFIPFFHSFNWYLILKKLGEKLRLSRAMNIWLLSAASKYLPGTVWQYLSQIYLCKKEGIARTKTFVCQVVEFSMNAISALFVFIISIFFWEKGILSYKEIVMLVVIIIATTMFLRSPILKRLINFGLRVIKREPIDFNLKLPSLLFIFLLYVILRVIQGISFYLFISSMVSIPLSLLPVLIGVFSIGWVAGYLFVIAPGGIGIREGAFVFFLSFFFPLPVAIAISLLSRVWIMISEFIAILMGYSIKK